MKDLKDIIKTMGIENEINSASISTKSGFSMRLNKEMISNSTVFFDRVTQAKYFDKHLSVEIENTSQKPYVYVDISKKEDRAEEK